MDKLQTLAQNIFNEIKDLNIDTISHCLTRIRISFNGSLPNIDNIKKIDGVKGVVTLGKEIQIVVGTQINQVYDYIKPLLDNKESNQQLKDTPLSQQNFDAVKNKYRKFNLLQTLGKFSKIFSPLIQAFVGAGIVAGIASLFLINQDTYGN
jgi:phosphotransferase system IIB component